MNPTSLLFLLLGVGLLAVGFYFIYPPLALIAGGVVSGLFAALFWEVEAADD